MDQILEHVVEKSRQTRHGSFDCLSTSEQIAAALAMNRTDWLAKMGCVGEPISRKIVPYRLRLSG